MIKSRGDDADIREDEAGIDYDSFKQMQRGARYFEIIDPNSNENKNTKRKTETDMRIFTAYLVNLLVLCHFFHSLYDMNSLHTCSNCDVFYISKSFNQRTNCTTLTVSKKNNNNKTIKKYVCMIFA